MSSSAPLTHFSQSSTIKEAKNCANAVSSTIKEGKNCANAVRKQRTDPTTSFGKNGGKSVEGGKAVSKVKYS